MEFICSGRVMVTRRIWGVGKERVRSGWVGGGGLKVGDIFWKLEEVD